MSARRRHIFSQRSRHCTGHRCFATFANRRQRTMIAERNKKNDFSLLTRKLSRFGRVFIFLGESRFGLEARACTRGACCFARTRFAANDPVAPRDGTVLGHQPQSGRRAARAQSTINADIHHCALCRPAESATQVGFHKGCGQGRKPRAFAACSAALVRCEIAPRSCSATAAKMCRVSPRIRVAEIFTRLKSINQPRNQRSKTVHKRIIL